MLFASCTTSMSEFVDVDMEIYEFEHQGHQYLIFTERGETISVIHDPDCKCLVKSQI